MSTLTQPSSSFDRYLRTAATILVGAVWMSAIIFGLYILCFYFIGLLMGNTTQWNEVLPGLYDEDSRSATLGIGLHFAAGQNRNKSVDVQQIEGTVTIHVDYSFILLI
ncbi:MAG: hypothetical protein AAGA31_20125 [Bacteroidota bacterium]